MADLLEDAFLAELRCPGAEASTLAELARARLRMPEAGDEDTDEDLVVRLRDPRVFGDFAASVLSDPRLSRRTKMALAEGAFDLLPLPRSEGDVILVESRAPRQLLSLASFLAAEEGLTVLHVMHLLYAVFLDRGLIAREGRGARTAVLEAVVSLSEANERLRVLYVGLHLASVPESEAHRDLRRLLRARGLNESVARGIALAASAQDGGLARLASLAQEEGLLPTGAGDAGEPSVVANIPRLPPALAAAGRRWLAAHKVH